MEIISRSVNETIKAGKGIAKYLSAGDILCLKGELGSGKTVFVKGIASGLGIEARDVISPSFVLIRCHSAKLPLFHFDLYRLSDPKDILNLGYEDYLFDGGVSAIEWPERLGCLMPKEFLKIELSLRTTTHRLLKFSARGEHYLKLLEEIHDHIRH